MPERAVDDMLCVQYENSADSLSNLLEYLRCWRLYLSTQCSMFQRRKVTFIARPLTGSLNTANYCLCCFKGYRIRGYIHK